MNKTVRTRFSPSPTGDLHAGGLRTALFNYLLARAGNGAYILRIEDTDTVRSDKKYEERITEDLRSLGLVPDESPEAGGKFGPYRQSERTAIYTEYALGLISKGLAYHCHCTPERLAELKAADVKAGRAPRYDGRCADKELVPIAGSTVIRFSVPKKSISFNDSVHGEMSFESSAFGDFIIIGSDGIASYNFAVTVDDALMEITDVVRGDDHLANTPRQLLLYRALGFTPPRFAHLPLVLAPDSTPLSKRHSHLSIRALREDGFLDPAILNCTVRLGWSPLTDGSAGIMDLGKMAQLFNGNKLSKSPSLFDLAHLTAFNRQAISAMNPVDLLTAAGINHDSATGCTAIDAVEAVKKNCSTIKEVEELSRPLLLETLNFSDAAGQILAQESAKEVLTSLLNAIKTATTATAAAPEYKALIGMVKKETGIKGRELFMPIRCALTGRADGIELEKIIQLLGIETTRERVQRVFK